MAKKLKSELGFDMLGGIGKGPGYHEKRKKATADIRKEVGSGSVSGITAQRLQERLTADPSEHAGLQGMLQEQGTLNEAKAAEFKDIIAEDKMEQDASLRQGPSQSSRVLSTNIFDEETEGGRGKSRKTLLGI